MSKKFIVAVSRQYGSGGHEIGRKLAEKLGVKFYDKELLAKIAQDSGMSKSLVEFYDEMPSKSLLFSLAMDAYPMSFTEVPINQKVFQAQVETIRKIPRKGPRRAFRRQGARPHRKDRQKARFVLQLLFDRQALGRCEFV